MSTNGTSQELIEELRAHLPEPLWEAVRGRIQLAEMKVQLLEEKLRLRRIEKYGPGSERLNAAQLELLEMEPGVSRDEVVAESVRPAPRPRPETEARAPRVGRQELPANLEREEVKLECTPEASQCGKCGGATVVIGTDESERLDVKPAEYFVVRTVREKRACRQCPDAGVVMAPLKPSIIERGLVSDAVVIDTLIAKYVDHLPLYRQSERLEREAGIEISRATMDGWVVRAGESLLPVVGAMAQEILAGGYIQADETSVGVQMHDRRGKNHQAYLWQYGLPGGSAVFDFRMGRSREGPLQFLAGFKGILQTDGYAAYGGVGGAGMVHAGCWAHARRKFIEAVKVNPADALAVGAVARFDALFALDARAREARLDLAARHQLRQSEAPALLGAIHAAAFAVRAAALPASALAKAANYTLAQWPKLTRFLEHPVVELSNNLAENSMRPIALGRKNWIHLGSERAAPRIAAILSVVETCRRLDIPLRAYLADVLPGLAHRPTSAFAALTPAAWAAKQSQP